MAEAILQADNVPFYAELLPFLLNPLRPNQREPKKVILTWHNKRILIELITRKKKI
ncbi:hypothetical protein [Thiomicrorhabdus sediminis]|uniref:hypothetical protein n=1 Tax=Thiomicrorhabdus sediminis TaxID=2580412 RepID=UPI00143DB5D7|nr:hypothetical protein [Thiomicrorhabdus sediminis]